MDILIGGGNTPTLKWMRLLGTEDNRVGYSAHDAAYSATIVSDGLIVGGIVGSDINGVDSTINVISAFHHGDDDGFVAKLSADGTKVTWFTNLGASSGATEVRDVLVRSDKSLVVVGNTDAKDFLSSPSATTGKDVFAIQLSTDGGAIASKRLGKSGSEVMAGQVALDGNDNVFFGGQTSSTDFAANGFDTSYDGTNDGFVVMLKADLSDVQWSAFVGGNSTSSSDEWVRGVARGSNAGMIIAGQTPPGSNFFTSSVGDSLSPKGGEEGFLLRVATDTTPPAPGEVTPGLDDLGHITVAWTEFSDEQTAVSYEWSIRDSDGSEVRLFTPATDFQATATNFTPQEDKPYYVRVRATNAVGCTTTAESTESVVVKSQPGGGPEGGTDGGGNTPPSAVPENLSPLGWGCGSSIAGGGPGALALATLVGLALFASRRRKGSTPRE